MKKTAIASWGEIEEGRSKKFLFQSGGEVREGFIVRRKKRLYAYLNRCRHVALPLDWGDNDFFTRDRRHLMCKSHGALYLPESGECVAGPCAGEFLEPVAIRVERGKVYLA